MDGAKAKELVFNVESAQGTTLSVEPILTQHTESISEHFNFFGNEEHRKRYQKKRNKRMKRQNSRYGKVKKNVWKTNEKFVIKIQSNAHPMTKHKLLAYDKNKKYSVVIDETKQKKECKKLVKLMNEHGIGGPLNPNVRKAYFYAWIDKRQKLHVLIDNVLALQPW